MNNKQGIIVTEVIEDNNDVNIVKPNFAGYHLNKFKENLLEEESLNTVEHILSNSYQAIGYFKRTKDYKEGQKPIKILCLGKIQSGKTSFFFSNNCTSF